MSQKCLFPTALLLILCGMLVEAHASQVLKLARDVRGEEARPGAAPALAPQGNQGNQPKWVWRLFGFYLEGFSCRGSLEASHLKADNFTKYF